MQVNKGVARYLPTTTEPELSDAVADHWFEQFFIDVVDWEDVDSAIQAARHARAVVDAAQVNRYQPVIISIARVPDDLRRKVLKSLAENHLSILDMTFDKYVDG